VQPPSVTTEVSQEVVYVPAFISPLFFLISSPLVKMITLSEDVSLWRASVFCELLNSALQGTPRSSQ